MVNKILVPIDGSDHAKKAIEYACDLAEKYEAFLYLVHVINKSEIPKGVAEYMEVEKIEAPPEEVYLKKVGDKIIEEAESLAREKGITKLRSHVLQGDPGKKLVEYANLEDVDLIVMGSRGLGAFGSAMLGSVSLKVCHMSKCSCVTVK